mmetsp:Transcript_46583/g.83329  ORF Transcript_46583/g.83329 Transcript_46583/m.83329 type:complete len:271 (+) Transcript_46583:893-1705(+)
MVQCRRCSSAMLSRMAASSALRAATSSLGRVPCHRSLSRRIFCSSFSLAVSRRAAMVATKFCRSACSCRWTRRRPSVSFGSGPASCSCLRRFTKADNSASASFRCISRTVMRRSASASSSMIPYMPFWSLSRGGPRASTDWSHNVWNVLRSRRSLVLRLSRAALSASSNTSWTRMWAFITAASSWSGRSDISSRAISASSRPRMLRFWIAWNSPRSSSCTARRSSFSASSTMMVCTLVYASKSTRRVFSSTLTSSLRDSSNRSSKFSRAW